ncbi:hypothetical protein OnM2_073066 [Erysiphe neolycopersici]|uniref:Uncharacterized protein n=1 Tax=Erysiphe neolycopersici TaxID=212602 RepID=A0A420HJK4_9PEZI|nr:hypothetical protein OnM2_073066 [Erysiphe neolycopersici]
MLVDDLETSPRPNPLILWPQYSNRKVVEKSILSLTTSSLEKHNRHATDVNVSDRPIQAEKISIIQSPVIPYIVNIRVGNFILKNIELEYLTDHISPKRSERQRIKKAYHINANEYKSRKCPINQKNRSLDLIGELVHIKNQPTQSVLSPPDPKNSKKINDAQVKLAPIEPSLGADGRLEQIDKKYDIETNNAIDLAHNPVTDLMIVDDNKPKVYAGEKRKRSDLYEIEKKKTMSAGTMRAIIDIVDKMGNTYTKNALKSELLVPTVLISKDTLIPKYYKQAINDPYMKKH